VARLVLFAQCLFDAPEQASLIVEFVNHIEAVLHARRPLFGVAHQFQVELLVRMLSSSAYLHSSFVVWVRFYILLFELLASLAASASGSDVVTSNALFNLPGPNNQRTLRGRRAARRASRALSHTRAAVFPPEPDPLAFVFDVAALFKRRLGPHLALANAHAEPLRRSLPHVWAARLASC
jgi:hypothetical protein